MRHAWRLDTPAQTLVLASREGGLPEVVHWGAPLPQDEDLEALAQALLPREVTGGMADARPPLTICPLAQDGHGGALGADLGDAHPRLALEHADYEPGRSLRAVFAGDGHRYTLAIEADAETDVLVLSAILDAPGPVRHLAAPALPGPPLGTAVTTFAGRWTSEFQRRDVPWSAGPHVREIREGRTSHQAYPGLLMPSGELRHETGEVFALALGQSTGHRLVIEELPDGRRHVMLGPVLHPAGATRVTAGPLYVTRSDAGTNGVIDAFHRHLRARLVRFPDPARPRPVHYNSWEAVYFRHDMAELKEIATRAAALGAERFVLDDGWFKGRSDDTTSLGDWIVDADKYPDGLHPLLAHVRALGMRFGLWVEPEMASPVSDLARAHPDWILGPGDQPLARNQLVLDLSRAQVREHLFARLDALLREYEIDYLKWDHNRALPGPDHRQADGFATLVSRLREAHPMVEIESCASGGGRLDWGALALTQRVWLSDSNDALERLRIQHEALPFLIPDVTGSHVGPRTCHTSGRILPMRLRAWTAAQRHFGFEMDPRELTPEEAEVLASVCHWWKERRDWLMPARRLRLDTHDPARLAEIAIAPDGDRFALWLAQVATPGRILPIRLRIPGLEREARYRVSLADPGCVSPLSRGGHPLLAGAVTLSGAALAGAGLAPPLQEPQSVLVLEGERLP
ncbi:alpha-galactosidase [Salinarimonas ramus]|uniref:alpha-galactosidase n=1 Tax=Salinarimonas ramus TaxID=690164 RepID=A0A917QJP6_9HYPH|nr:alpha-galactosidase [Salinarimonas ramus]GGK53744.1 alpha-galactosidase [Salinarimonas ramus]